MSLLVATLFAFAFALSLYAILLTVAQKQRRIEEVLAMRGTPSPTAHREAETAKAHRG